MFRCFRRAVPVSVMALAVIAVASVPASGADRPVTGDWDGNNTTTIGIARPESGKWHWYLRNSNSSGTPSTDFLYGNS